MNDKGDSPRHSSLVTRHVYWRSLDELADTPAFREWLHREFPRQASVWHDEDGLSRRQFLKLMGASLMLAGLTACTVGPPGEKIVPYVRQPEEITPGRSLFFATATTLGGYATGLLVRSEMGRPIKVEGNPQHPASLGATNAFAQASVLTLYDPDRAQSVMRDQRKSDWNSFVNDVRAALDAQRARQGAGLRILTETVTSPSLASQLQTILRAFPAAKWHPYEPVNHDNTRAGAQLAFGAPLDATYHCDKADVILALDSDFLFDLPASLNYARAFATRRRPQNNMNRLYAVESTPSITGAKADHRIPMRASEIEGFARAVASRLGVDVGAALNLPTRFVDAIARDLQRVRGAGLVIAGRYQPPIVHALAHAMNSALGSVGNTVTYSDPADANPIDQTQSLRDLVNDMDAGRVELLLILGGNPVYSAPADLQFGERLKRVGLRVHLGLYDDETSALCQWHVNEAHELEAWSDARAFDGTVTIVQPLIAPLYGGKSAHELLALITGQPEQSAHDIVKAYWKSQNTSADFDSFWRKVLHDGIVPNTSLPTRTPTLRADALRNPTSNVQSPASNLELIFRPDYAIYDGRFANNAWLQELPKPLTKLTWDNVALISPAMAQRMSLDNGDLLELKYQGRTMRAPVWIMPGHPDNAVSVQLGYGRTRAGKVGTELGYNAYALRASNAPWFDLGLEIRKVGEDYRLATTQRQQTIEGRNILREGTLEEFRKNPNFVHEMDGEHKETASLYPDWKYEGYKWGMAINLGACIGCNACVIACQAENNIPVVGKAEVLRERKMHWLRIDTYFKGDVNGPQTFFQPVPCMHCENAPCEVVCPTAATTHSAEGLNEMTYNRCIGTRYCSNNCPYKVRRFNFFDYSDYHTPSLKLLNNPDVTVRTRGVMEKCTYCVQRINRARISAETEGRRIRDGEVVTACQAACPTEAIVFGDLNDANSRVVQLKADPLNYDMLGELNTRPRTTYLAEVRDLNPEIGER